MIRISGPLLLLMLAACAGGRLNTSLDTQKVATITTSQIAYDLRFGPGNTLSESQTKALADYLAAIRIGYGDHISIDDPIPYAADERRAAVATVIAKFGMLVEENGPVAPVALRPGVTRIVITRPRAEVPNCPDWSRPSNPETEFSLMSNFGCAVQGNLAAMTADPNDLLTGKPYSGADGNSINKAISAYRSAAPSGGGGTVVNAMSPGGK